MVGICVTGASVVGELLVGITDGEADGILVVGLAVVGSLDVGAFVVGFAVVGFDEVGLADVGDILG